MRPGGSQSFPRGVGLPAYRFSRSYPVKRLPCARSELRVSVQQAVFILIFDDSPVQ